MAKSTTRTTVAIEMTMLAVLAVAFALVLVRPMSRGATDPVEPAGARRDDSMASVEGQDAPSSSAAGRDPSATQTTPDATAARPLSVAWGARPDVDHRIDLRSARPQQAWRGVGAALTDASAELLRAHPAAIDMLFEPDAGRSAGLDLIRLPLSATDFSSRPWTWTLHDDGRVEPAPEALEALDTLDRIRRVQPALQVVAAAWTSPSAMRSEPDSPGGALLDGAIDGYARLLIGQVEYLAERGVPLAAISLGNEPGHVANYPTLTMTTAQMIDLSRRVEPHLEGTELWALDHNWSDSEIAHQLEQRGKFDAVAYHCYDGAPAEMADVALPRLVSECTATTGGWRTSVGWMARELVGNSIRAGSEGLIMWNLALDPDHGPKAPGGCETCRGLLVIDPATGAATTTPEFDVLTHLSTAADPGASVLATDAVRGLSIAAFRNPDGSIGVFGHNDSANMLSLEFRMPDEHTMTVEVEPWALFSIRT